LKAVQASLKASLASLRDEMNRKLQAMTIEIAQLQKQMNVQRGEQNILAQQSKDTSKRLEVVAGHVSDLAAEVHGDEAHVAVAGGSSY
jgi:septal ring factor EnvC (AmiA/AmiB activator)